MMLNGTKTLFLIVMLLIAVRGEAVKWATDSSLREPPSQTDIATETPTPIPTPAAEPITNQFLLEQMERVSGQTLTLTQWVVGSVLTLIVGSGILGTFITIRGNAELERIKDRLTTSTEKFGDQIKENREDFVKEKKVYEAELDIIRDQLNKERESFAAQVKKLSAELNEVQKMAVEVQERFNSYKLFFEANDSNTDVRIRAVQKLGTIDDLGVMSTLIDRLLNDVARQVKVEAAYAIGNFLSNGGNESTTLTEGVTALVEATKDIEPTVRLEAIEALDRIVLASKSELRRDGVRRMFEIVKYDADSDVVRAAKNVLEHVERGKSHPI